MSYLSDISTGSTDVFSSSLFSIINMQANMFSSFMTGMSMINSFNSAFANNDIRKLRYTQELDTGSFEDLMRKFNPFVLQA